MAAGDGDLADLMGDLMITIGDTRWRRDEALAAGLIDKNGKLVPPVAVVVVVDEVPAKAIRSSEHKARTPAAIK